MLGAFAETALWPPKLRAAGKSNPRGTARFCIVVEAAGAISHVDTFDFKENEGTPKDLDVRPIRNELYLSHRLFPEMATEMDKVSIVRTFKSHEVVHFRGEYYTRAGRPLNPAQVAEIPPVGSVVALRARIAAPEVRHIPDLRLVQSELVGAADRFPASAILRPRYRCQRRPGKRLHRRRRAGAAR